MGSNWTLQRRSSSTQLAPVDELRVGASHSFGSALADWIVVAVDAPFGYLAVFNVGAEGRWSAPTILGLQLSMRYISSLGNAEHNDYWPFAVGFFNGHGVIG